MFADGVNLFRLTMPLQLWAVVMGIRARNFVPFQRDVLLPMDMPRRRAFIRLNSQFRSRRHQPSSRDSGDSTPSSRRLPVTPRLSASRSERENGLGGADPGGTSVDLGPTGEVRVRGGGFVLSPSHAGGLQTLSSVFGSTQGPRTPIRSSPPEDHNAWRSDRLTFQGPQTPIFLASAGPPVHASASGWVGSNANGLADSPSETQENELLPILSENETVQSASDGATNRHERPGLLRHVEEDGRRDAVTAVVEEMVVEIVDLSFAQAEKRNKENEGPSVDEDPNLAGMHQPGPL